jgi:hypothetical protein
MIKKMMLLALAIGAFIALAAPSVASAYEEGVVSGSEGEGATGTEGYEGFLKFTTMQGAQHSVFECNYTLKMHLGGGAFTVIEFRPTTTSCEGTGVFAGCKLKNDTSNVPWGVGIGAALTINGPITLTNMYEGCSLGITGSELTFNSITATPTLNGGGWITSLALAGTATNGVTKLSGSMSAEGDAVLGLK